MVQTLGLLAQLETHLLGVVHLYLLCTRTSAVSGSAVYTCPTCPAGSFVTTDYGFAYFNPAQAGPGTYDITYCFDNGCGCSGCQTEQITVVNPYDASFTYSAPTYCQYDADPTASITGDAGGTFTSTPGGLSLNSASGAIDVSASTPGSYTVSYTVGSGAIDYSGSCNDVVIHCGCYWSNSNSRSRF